MSVLLRLKKIYKVICKALQELLFPEYKYTDLTIKPCEHSILIARLDTTEGEKLPYQSQTSKKLLALLSVSVKNYLNIYTLKKGLKQNITLTKA